MDMGRSLKDSAFGPEDIETMTAAYENALTIAGITDRASPASERLANKIIELVRHGERNPVQLCGKALGEIEDR